MERLEVKQRAGRVTLDWPGKRSWLDVSVPEVNHRTRFQPAGVTEAATASLFLGDNLGVMASLLETHRGKVKLAYLDPPFDTAAVFRRPVKLRGATTKNPASKGPEQVQYRDVWEGHAYLQFMLDRLMLVRELLAGDGSLFVHCDYRRNHHLRALLDEVFGADHLVNEIVWSYKSGGRSKTSFARKHDTLLWYRKGKKHLFHPDAVGEPRGASKRNNMKRGVAEDGRSYGSIRSNGKEYRYYDDELIIPTDVWEMGHLQQRDPERENYPTQKPKQLLKRIVAAASSPGDWVMDPFVGSGTSAVVALELGRCFVGVDQNPVSVHTTTQRCVRDVPGTVIDVFHQEPLAMDADPNTHARPLAALGVDAGEIVISSFAPGPALADQGAHDWRQLVESIYIDFDYDGSVMRPSVIDAPMGSDWVRGRYAIPDGASRVRVRVTDVTSAAWEGELS